MTYAIQPLPAGVRERAVQHLRDKLTERQAFELTHDMDGDYFHFGPGMWVRNLLRDVVADSELPSNAYPEGAGNWDDYYVSVLREALHGA